MFQKKECIFSDAIGVCFVEDIVKLSAQKNAAPILYYVLRSMVDKKKTSYIPVENHRSLLRPLISLEEAQDVLEAAWAKEKRAEAESEGTDKGQKQQMPRFAGYPYVQSEQDSADAAEQAQQEKLLQEAMFVVERYQRRLEELKGSET